MKDPAPRRLDRFTSLLLAVLLSAAMSSCVTEPYGIGGGPAYGGSGSDWNRDYWKKEEANRREMVRRQEDFRRKLAESDRARKDRADEWRRDVIKQDEDYRREISERRGEVQRQRDGEGRGPLDDGGPTPYELSPERRLEPPDATPPSRETPGRNGGTHPVGIPVIGKEGMVYNPGGNPQQMIDVRGIPSGTLVKDPYTETLFRVP